MPFRAPARVAMLLLVVGAAGCTSEHQIDDYQAKTLQFDGPPFLVEGKPFSGKLIAKDSDGDVSFRARMKDGHFDGEVEVYDKKVKRLVTEMAWDEDKRAAVLDGTETLWDAKGEMISRKTADHGELEISEKWCAGAKPRLKIDYKKGKKAHEQEWDCATGKLVEETRFDDEGNRHGQLRAWSPAGVLVKSENYEHGKQTGLSEQWHPNGKPAARANLVGGKTVGKYESWDEAGLVLESGSYDSKGEKTGLWQQQYGQVHYGPDGFIKPELFEPYVMALATDRGDPAVVEFYLKDGQVKLSDRLPANSMGQPALGTQFRWPQSDWTYAIIAARPELVPALLARGADLSQGDSKGRTRLMRCADRFNSSGHDFDFIPNHGAISLPTGCDLAHLQLLLPKSKAAQTDLEGRNALHHLVAGSGSTDTNYRGVDAEKSANRVAAVKALLQGGAAVDAKDKAGWSPLVIALSERQYDLARTLLQAGANAKQAGPGNTLAIHWVMLSAPDRYSVIENEATTQILGDLVKGGANISAPFQWEGKPTTLRDLAMRHGLVGLVQSIDALAASGNVVR